VNRPIDVKIAPLVEKMNSTGVIHTIASCQGHVLGYRPPYVYFLAPVEIAAAIEQRLREASMLDEPWANTMWVVKGAFDCEYRLCFRLYSPEYDEKCTSMMWAMWLFGFKCRRLDEELRALSRIVEDVLVSESEVASDGITHNRSKKESV